MNRHAALVSGVAGLLWVAVAALNQVLSVAGLRGLENAVFPATVSWGVWAWPAPWPLLYIAGGALAVASVHAALTLPRRDGAAHPPARVWLGTAAAGAIVGFTLDAAAVVGWVLRTESLGAVSGLGGAAMIGAYWGLLYGWVPALVAERVRSAAARGSAADGSRDTWRRLLPLGSVVVLAIFAVTSVLATRAAITAEARASAVLEGADESEGAFPDPLADGEPVPTLAPGEVPARADWCGPDRAMLLLGGSDAATGHRVQSIQLMNFSDEPCVIEGYIDIAFGDQNGHALDVTIERGSSFMAQDPGAAQVEIPAQGYAIAHLGWDANATAGALVARSLHAAVLPGLERGSWPIENDVVAGSTVTITAWQLASAASVQGGE